jgi:hypothetical protein
VSRLLGKSIYQPDELLTIAASPSDESCIADATEWIAEKIFAYAETSKITLDGVAKSSQFKEYIANSFQPA